MKTVLQKYRPFELLACLLCVLAVSSCKKEHVAPAGSPADAAPVGYANVVLNGQPLELPIWCGGSLTGSGTVHSFTGCVRAEEGSERWTMVIATALDESTQLPINWNTGAGELNIVVSITHWPNYPSQAGLEMHSTHEDVEGSVIITRFDRFVGGFIQGSFDLQNLQHGDVDSGNETLGHTLFGEFSINVRSVQ